MNVASFLTPAFVAAGLALATPAGAGSPSEDVADLSNSACLKVASGELIFPHPAKPEFAATVEKLGLKAGIDKTAFDMLGRATALVSRAAMAQRKNGDAYIVLASDGALPGCRVILLAEPSPDALDAVAAALERPAVGGWTAFTQMTATRGSMTKRVFLRRDKSGKPHLLNLVGLNGTVGKVQLYTTVVAVPAGVTLPEGF